MIQTSFHLPSKYRLDINLVKERKNLDEEPLLPNLGKVFRAKKGCKVSRFFRLLFENKKVKRLIGTNFIALIIVSSFAPVSANFQDEGVQNISSPTVLNTESAVQYPVKTIKITQYYHFFHPGVDFDGVTGDSVYPLMAGTVERVEYSRFGYGKSVLISHGESTRSLYAHLSKIEVVHGQKVDKATKIGEMGATGRAFGDHLHFEVQENGKAINPLSILPQ